MREVQYDSITEENRIHLVVETSFHLGKAFFSIRGAITSRKSAEELKNSLEEEAKKERTTGRSTVFTVTTLDTNTQVNTHLY